MDQSGLLAPQQPIHAHKFNTKITARDQKISLHCHLHYGLIPPECCLPIQSRQSILEKCPLGYDSEMSGAMVIL